MWLIHCCLCSVARACSEDAEKYCKDMEWYDGYRNGSIIACLREVKQKLTLICRREVFKVQLDASYDYRADKMLFEACQKDAETLCKDVKNGGGRVQACLVSWPLAGRDAAMLGTTPATTTILHLVMNHVICCGHVARVSLGSSNRRSLMRACVPHPAPASWLDLAVACNAHCKRTLVHVSNIQEGQQHLGIESVHLHHCTFLAAAHILTALLLKAAHGQALVEAC